MQRFYVCSFTGTIEAQRQHAKVCAHRDVACPLTYCVKHSCRGNPILLMPAHTMVGSTRKEHPYITYVNNPYVIAYCETALKPPHKLPQKSVSWAFCMHVAQDDDYLVECEYDQDRRAWLAGVVAINADKHEYKRANINIGNTVHGQMRRVDISVVNKENLHKTSTMNAVMVDESEGGISFYEEMTEKSVDPTITIMCIRVDLLRENEFYPPIGTPTMKVRPTTITVQPYAIGKHALPPPPYASVGDRADVVVASTSAGNSSDADAVAAPTAPNAVAATARELGNTDDDDDDETTRTGNVQRAGIDYAIDADAYDDSTTVTQTTAAAIANMPSTSNSAANANAAAAELSITPRIRSNGEPSNQRQRMDAGFYADLNSDDDDSTVATAANADAAARSRGNRFPLLGEREQAKRQRVREQSNLRRRALATRRRQQASDGIAVSLQHINELIDSVIH